MYLICRRKGKCFARVIISWTEQNIEKGPQQSEHNHAPNSEEVQALKIVNRIKRVADEHPETPAVQILRTNFLLQRFFKKILLHILFFVLLLYASFKRF